MAGAEPDKVVERSGRELDLDASMGLLNSTNWSVALTGGRVDSSENLHPLFRVRDVA